LIGARAKAATAKVKKRKRRNDRAFMNLFRFALIQAEWAESSRERQPAG
jgi:hypothetical protein